MKGGNLRKYGSIVIVSLMVLTVFAVMSGAHGASAVPRNSPAFGTSSGILEISRQFSVSLKDIKQVAGPNGERYLLIKGTNLMQSPGKPMLPVKIFTFTLPRNAKIVNIGVNGISMMNYGNVKISPGPQPVPKSGKAYPTKYALPKYNMQVYGKNAFYPAKTYAYRIGYTNHETVLNVYLYPLQYNPITHETRVISHANVVVDYKLIPLKSTAPVINAENIIITSPLLKEQAQRLADFHNSTGVTSWVVTTDWIAKNFDAGPTPPYDGYANDTTYFYHELGTALPLIKEPIRGYNYTLARKIVAFLQNETGGNVTYVTIFGNARMVPPSYYWVDQYPYLLAYFGIPGYDLYDAWIPTDAFYASPDYNSTYFDFTPNFFLGRLPVNPLTAKAMVDKIIYYANHKSGLMNVTLSGGQVFETSYFLGETGVLEPINAGWMNGVKITEYFHTLRNFTYNNFVKMMKNSDMIIEITHGSGFSFWHHNDDINAWDFSMNASYGSLPIYASGSCLNGAWDEEVYPSEFAMGINGGTSIAEKMLYAPDGIIAYFGGDREAYGSTAAYFVNGTLVAPNDFGDLITEDGTAIAYKTAMENYGYVTLGMLYYYALYYYNVWIGPNLPIINPWGYGGYNWNLWQRSYFEFSGLGDPALKVAGNGTSAPAYSLPKVEVRNAVYNAQDVPVITRGHSVTVDIKTDSPTVKAELLYLEHDVSSSGESYYDFILGTQTLTPVSSSGGVNDFTYAFTPSREGTYILSVYSEDGKNTRLYMACGVPSVPGISVSTQKNLKTYSNIPVSAKQSGPDVEIITLLDYGDIAFGKETNVTAVLYNSGNETANNIVVHFYLENYVLAIQQGNLSAPLVWLGNATLTSLAPGEIAYVTIPWKAVNLIPLGLDPTNSSARWQYLVASADVAGDVNPDNNAYVALFHVHLPVDVWAQKVFLEKDPMVGVPNAITFEISNIGTTDTATTNVTVMDAYGVIDTLQVTLAPGETKFLTVPWTPAQAGWDYVAVFTSTPGDINTRNDVGLYYPNGYYGVYMFKVLSYDVAALKLSQNGDNLDVTLYNYGPVASPGTTVQVKEYLGVTPYHVESPHPYPDNYDNIWKIEAPGATSLALHFEYLDVEPNYDYVLIYNETGALQVYYTGFYNNLWTPFINGSTLYVRLVSDEAVHYSGFVIDAYANGAEFQIVSLGNITFGSIGSGEFATEGISLGNVTTGPQYFEVNATTPDEVATLNTGGDSNNKLSGFVNIQDTVPPVITGMSPNNVVINDRSPTLQIQFHDTIYSGFSEISVKVDGIEIGTNAKLVANGNDGSIAVKVPFLLVDGEHSVVVTLVDNGGNEVSEEWNFTIDATPPQLVITSPVGMNVPLTYNSTLKIEGITEPDATVTINGVTVPVGNDGKFSYDATLVKGENIFYIVATDPYGNSAYMVVTALYLPDLPQLWNAISDLKSQISQMQGDIEKLNSEINGLKGDVNGLKANISAMEERLNELQIALKENVTALNKAIEDANTTLMNEINNNIATLQGQINDLKSQISDAQSQIKSVQDENKKQSNQISGADTIGYVGIVLAIIALIIAIVAIARKPKKPEMPESSESEESESEE